MRKSAKWTMLPAGVFISTPVVSGIVCGTPKNFAVNEFEIFSSSPFFTVTTFIFGEFGKSSWRFSMIAFVIEVA